MKCFELYGPVEWDRFYHHKCKIYVLTCKYSYIFSFPRSRLNVENVYDSRLTGNGFEGIFDTRIE